MAKAPDNLIGKEKALTLISLVVPAYNEAQSLPILYPEIEKACKCIVESDHNTSFEVIFVDDGSSDDTLEVIRSIKEKSLEDSFISVRYISFSRNFGKEAALYAGLRHARGNYIATMDADMQDPPSLLPEMYRVITTCDCDNVAAKRLTRKGEPAIRSFFARRFYKLANNISAVEFVDGMRDFRLMKQTMVNAVLSLTETNRFSKGIFCWVGFKTEWLEYDHVSRASGKTKWNFFALLRYSIEGITAFSAAPLSVASVSGLLMCGIAILTAIFIIVRTLAFGDPVSGWPSLACIVLFVGGLQLFCLGIIGEYLARAYLEVKRRPLYIVRETDSDTNQ